jgi:DNA-binding transcriptional regulator YiaG
MKIKNYEWNGFGFPIIFDQLPGIKMRGKLIPDIDMEIFSKPLIEFICANQDIPLSGNQVKFIRNYFGMSLREFAKTMNIKHQSVMRWEEKKQSAARIDVNTEIVLRLMILKKLKSKALSIKLVVDKIDNIETFESAGHYKQFKPLRVPSEVLQLTY